jgi:dUTPase
MRVEAHHFHKEPLYEAASVTITNLLNVPIRLEVIPAHVGIAIRETQHELTAGIAGITVNAGIVAIAGSIVESSYSGPVQVPLPRGFKEDHGVSIGQRPPERIKRKIARVATPDVSIRLKRIQSAV